MSDATGPVDAEYTFGRPASTYLSPHQIVRLTILRSKLADATLAELVVKLRRLEWTA